MANGVEAAAANIFDFLRPFLGEAVDLAKAAKDKGIRVLDAPVSGGEAGAIEAVLSIRVVGEQADFDEAKPILEALGTTIVLCGPHGSGQTVKAANQLIVASNICAVAEALLLAERGGADPARVREALLGGFADSIARSRLSTTSSSSARTSRRARSTSFEISRRRRSRASSNSLAACRYFAMYSWICLSFSAICCSSCST